MKPKLFRKLRVFGLMVPVFKMKGLIAEQGMYAYYTSDKKIGVDNSLKGQELEATILHEMFHAVLDRVHAHQQMSPEFAEIVVENLARSVVDNYNVRWKK